MRMPRPRELSSTTPQPSRSECLEVECRIDQLKTIARLVGKVLAVFPQEKFDRVQSSGPRAKFLQSGGWHAWQELGYGRARCIWCLTLSNDSGSRPMLGCNGMPRTWNNTLDLSLGHSLAHCTVIQGTDERFLFFCTVCGAYTSRRCRLLGRECQQHKLAG
eukprot:8510974-Pyramimonas_sp.AAC.1